MFQEGNVVARRQKAFDFVVRYGVAAVDIWTNVDDGVVLHQHCFEAEVAHSVVAFQIDEAEGFSSAFYAAPRFERDFARRIMGKTTGSGLES